MAGVIKLKEGLDIRLDGASELVYGRASQSEMIGFNPDDFYGMVPKPVLKPGDAVKIGTVLFVDKNHPNLKVVSPVSGELVAVNRGERRKILDIVVKNDFKMKQESIKAVDLNSSADEIKQSLSDAGMFAFIKQRPYDVMANPDDTPKAIFISTFDNAPLSPDFDFIFKNEQSDFQNGIDALSKIAPVYVGIKNGTTTFSHVKNATVTTFEGNYPSCNVGVQINKVNPINKGDIVWTITTQDVVCIGRFVGKGLLDFSRTIVLAGTEVDQKAYYKMILGESLAQILKANVYESTARIISGNPLSGKQTTVDAWLSPFVSQITALKDGKDEHEFIGWIMPRFDKYSESGSFFTKFLMKLCPKKTFNFDTRILGGHRQMIMSGEYDKVMPMDIYPEYLIKAILAGDIDKMEALGIYEVIPEDFAAAEFVCSSKMELQRIVREGLDMLRKEMC